MRPVNLIPPEDRRGGHAPLRTGITAYVLLGGLAIALLTVTALVLTGNSVKDREAELAALEAREATATQTVQALNPYVQFASLAAARDQTVTSLADSRFDWERVLRELSLVIPDDVWLTGATGTVAPGTSTGASGAAANELREEITGPALELVGCASSQQAVAGFVAALEDIDGATRVGISSSESGASSTGGGGSSGASADCRTRNFIARFDIVVAFDEAPAAAALGAVGDAAVPTDAGAATSPETADAEAQHKAAVDSTAEQTQQADDAASVVTGGSP